MYFLSSLTRNFSFNKYSLRNGDLVDFLLDNLIMDTPLDSKIFDLLSILIKQSAFLEFDHEILKRVSDFALVAFFPSYKRLEHFTKATRRKHLESVEGFAESKICMTARKSGEQFDFSSTTTRNNKKLAVSANLAGQNQTNQGNANAFLMIHRFENAISMTNPKKIEILQLKIIEFLIKLHEFPQTFVPVKLILNIFQAKSLISGSSAAEQRKLLTSLSKLFGLSLLSSDNRKTLVVYEDLATLLKPYCNEPAFYSYVLLALLKKLRFDTDVDKSFEKEERITPNYFRLEDVTLLAQLIFFLKNSLKHLKFLISTLQSEDHLQEISQIFSRSSESSQDKRFSLLPAPFKNSFCVDSMDADLKSDELKPRTEMSISPDFLRLQGEKILTTSIEEISYPADKKSSYVEKPLEKQVTPYSLSRLIDPNAQKADEEEGKYSPSQVVEFNDSRNDDSTIKESPGTAEPLLKIFNISPTRGPSAALLKGRGRTPNPLQSNKKKVGIVSLDVDFATQTACRQKLVEMLIRENSPVERSSTLFKNLLKYFNDLSETQTSEDPLGYLSLPNYAMICQCFEVIMHNLIRNRSLLSHKISENLLQNVIDILQAQMDISMQLSAENINVSNNFINFLGFCLCEVLSNEMTTENDSNFLAFAKFSDVLLDNYPLDKYFQIVKVALETLIEKIDENNLLDYCRTLKKISNLVFAKLVGSFQKNIDWFSNIILNFLKRFFYYNKGPKEPKTPSTLKTFFNKFSMKAAGERSPMVKSEHYDKLNKRDKTVVNEFKGEMQSLLRKCILFELSRNIEMFEESKEEELLVARLKEFEENEKIIFDEEFESQEFHFCLFCLFGQMIERSLY